MKATKPDIITKQRELAIENFLTLAGPPTASHSLRWEGKESFFDRGVQDLLHSVGASPADIESACQEELALPIRAWSAADAFARFPTPDSLAANGISDWLCDPDLIGFFTALLAAVASFHEGRRQNGSNETGTLEIVHRWRTDAYLEETSRLAQPADEARRVNQAIAKARAFIGPVQMPYECADPLYVESLPEPPRKYLEGVTTGPAKDLSAGQVRKAIHDENARRAKIMRRWAPCWLAYLNRWPEADSTLATASASVESVKPSKKGSVTKRPRKG